MFPQRRLRRLRRTPALRRMVSETTVTPNDLVAPLFVREGITEPQPISSLPGVVQFDLASTARTIAAISPTRTASCRSRCVIFAMRWVMSWC